MQDHSCPPKNEVATSSPLSFHLLHLLFIQFLPMIFSSFISFFILFFLLLLLTLIIYFFFFILLCDRWILQTNKEEKSSRSATRLCTVQVRINFDSLLSQKIIESILHHINFRICLSLSLMQHIISKLCLTSAIVPTLITSSHLIF